MHMCSEIRIYQEDDEYEILDLLELVFGQWPGYDIKCDPIDHWRWKYLENPVNKGLISLCLDNDKIIGCFHSVPMNKRIGQRYFPYETYKYVKIKEMNEHIKNWDDVSATKIFGYRTLYTLNIIKRSYSKIDVNSYYDIINIDHFSESINEFWDKVNKEYDFIVE